MKPKKYVVKDNKIGCVKHNGEHPFYYKKSVNGFVTYCHEVLTVSEYRSIEKNEPLNGIEVTCIHDGYTWIYKGKLKNPTCPSCHRNTPIEGKQK